MGRIQIQIQEVRNDNYTLPSLISKLDNCEKELAVLRWRMPSDIKGINEIKDHMLKVKNEIEDIKEKINSLYRITNICVNEYASVENRIERRANDFM